MDNRVLLAAALSGDAAALNELQNKPAISAASFGLSRNGQPLYHCDAGTFTAEELTAYNRNRSGEWGAYAMGYADEGKILGRVPGIGNINEHHNG